MTQQVNETGALPLFNHTTRKDWGVAVLVREEGGKRGYLFEDGEERTMANGYHQLMRRVEEPSVEQRAFYERQRAVLARRQANPSNPTNDGPSFLDQLEKLHQAYATGLADPKWLVDVRGQGGGDRTPRHRDALIRDAQEQLSASALDALLKAQSNAQVWDLVLALLSRTDLVPAAQLKKKKSTRGDWQRGLALAVRDLLHGTAPYDQRFDAYINALSLVYGEAPPWELATALSAAFNPSEHIAVHPAAFRQQLKAMGARGSVSTRATSAGYTRFLSIARVVTGKLKEQGQPPRDLFDVYDFVRMTLAPVPKARAAAVKAKPKAAKASAEDTEADSDSDE